MSKVKIQGNASGTGTFTISAPNSNTDRSLTLPDGAGEFVTADASGDVTISGDINVSGSTSGTTKAIAANSTATEVWHYIGSSQAHFRKSDDSANLLTITSDGRGLSQFTAKAWVNFSGQNTIAIRDSHNVSSLTDNGTGDYSINFSNNMANTHYCVVSTGRLNQGTVANVPSQQTTSATRCQCYMQHDNTYYDNDAVQLVIFGD